MKKSKAKSGNTARKTRSGNPAQEKRGMSRRDLLTSVQIWGLGAAVVAGAGWFGVGEVCASVRNHDLSRIGQGVATVVQIHDPQCTQCLALQRETQDALDAFGEHELQYVIANIRSDEGRAFARSHNVGHVTLILFDGAGNPRNVLVGPNQADRLERAFRRHVDRYSGS